MKTHSPIQCAEEMHLFWVALRNPPPPELSFLVLLHTCEPQYYSQSTDEVHVIVIMHMQRTSSSGRVVYGRNGQVQRPEGQLVIAVRLFWTRKDPQLTSECQISQPPSEVLSKPWQKTNSIRGGTCCSGTSLYIGLHCCALPSGGLRLFIIILCVANCRTNLQRIHLSDAIHDCESL